MQLHFLDPPMFNDRTLHHRTSCAVCRHANSADWRHWKFGREGWSVATWLIRCWICQYCISLGRGSSTGDMSRLEERRKFHGWVWGKIPAASAISSFYRGWKPDVYFQYKARSKYGIGLRVTKQRSRDCRVQRMCRNICTALAICLEHHCQTWLFLLFNGFMRNCPLSKEWRPYLLPFLKNTAGARSKSQSLPIFSWFACFCCCETFVVSTSHKPNYIRKWIHRCAIDRKLQHIPRNIALHGPGPVINVWGRPIASRKPMSDLQLQWDSRENTPVSRRHPVVEAISGSFSRATIVKTCKSVV